MKLLQASSILAIAATLAATTISAIAANQNILPSATNTPATLIAQGESTPLAKQLQGKPVVVDIYASWCPGCKNIAPTLAQLRRQYAGKANFVALDVSDSKKMQASMKTAAKLGLTSFFNANKAQTATIAIIDPATGKVTQQFRNNADLTAYTSILNSSIAQMGSGDAMKKALDK
ncbi:thioredoxin domain-containing protein [Chamaesiphon sp. VAR_69_metabat_338]|uniref:TlpA family protein disulfide reductase n=1 Tax=Chamaesiphon sp. VAR_69_metabat_338 TaxID=2964704 RepID=UPI00286DA996|nr:thioredoxin domain-containing protein [Chamaesiphon sp. VAR_69_metabat_338]